MAKVKSKTKTAKARDVSKKLPREVLRDLRKRAGYSAAEVARLLEYASTNGYIQYEYDHPQGDKLIPSALIVKLVPLFRGRGTPPVTADELLAISDARSLPGLVPQPVAPEFTRTAALPTRYRVDAGVFIDNDALGTHQYGDAPLCASVEYVASAQFAVMVVDGNRREILHCVTPDKMPPDARANRRCVYARERGTSGLSEVLVGRVGADGELAGGDIIGVVIGAYLKE